MKFAVATLAVSVLLGSMPLQRALAAVDAGVGGTVRDRQGIPLAGAVVELLAPDASVLARAVTDTHGRYLFHALSPGSYQVRASVAALLPAMRSNLQVHAGSRALADLTLAALFEAGTWLPAEHRTAAEPTDDWRWTLRSTGNRPLLRLAGGGEETTLAGDGESSSSLDGPRRPTARGEIRLVAGDGSFGEGGAHQVILLDRDSGDGVGSVLRANLRGASNAAPGSILIDAGMQRAKPLGGGTRLLVSYASHPEIQTAAGTGLTTLRSAATEKIVLGDTISVDAGSLFTAEHLLATRMRSAPYLRIDVHPTPGTAIEYRFATDRVLQSSEDTEAAHLPTDALCDSEGQPLLRKSLHQELSASGKTEQTLVTVAVFQDSFSASTTQGFGPVGSTDFTGLPLMSDAVTGTVHLALPGNSGRGVRIALHQQIDRLLSAALDAETGPALEIDSDAHHLADVQHLLHTRRGVAVSGALFLTARQTGTKVAVSYRWQPLRTLTQVDEFDGVLQQAYLGVQLRQKLWTGQHRRQINGVVEGRNLLAEGYVPLSNAEGQAVFLAQMPRAVQAGLAFTF